jgi:CheY-like chemotaxis protein
MQQKDLSEIFTLYKSDIQIYHDLMKFRVREILIVTTLYDAYILEEEDRLTEHIFGEYYKLNLSSAPRITNASFGEEALELLENRKFDIVIITLRIGDMTPFELIKKIKELNPVIPVFLLLHDNNDIHLLGDRKDVADFEKVFVWNRDSKIFLAIIKYIEDKINVVNDTKIGLVRVILLVENSVRYYSRYLPTLYGEVIRQTQRLIEEEHRDEMKKILRMNAMPKILLAVSYEEAIDIIEKYKDSLLCVISDVKFPKEGKIYDFAGIDLVKYVKDQLHDLPTVLQSSDSDNSNLAVQHNSYFINKNSETLSSDLRDFIFNYLGFGDFVFRIDNRGVIEHASTMKEFQRQLKKIPYESLFFHANRNHFSAWLMARGEIRIAKKLQPVKVTDFQTAQELRNYLIDVFENVDYQSIKGKVIDFDETLVDNEEIIIRLADGSLGGKGRGMAFINSLIQNINPESQFSGVKIKIPKTAVIGTGEYDEFLTKNKISNVVLKETNFEEIKKIFLKSNLSRSLSQRLKLYLRHINKPLAVRSSGLFEDSISESFSGVYQTYLLPNNHPNFNIRVKHLEDAIKLVYASVYSHMSRSYFEAINYKVEEEKMAVVIQEVVGNLYSSYYYPDFSGVAQSYNYYPISYMKPEDGIAISAVGLGKYVIDGEKAYRFSPKFPKIDIFTPEAQLKNTQEFFYAIDMNKNEINLISGEDVTLTELPVSVAEKDDRLNYVASVWDSQNGIMKVGLESHGPRIINFAYILKYNALPLAKVIQFILSLVKNAMGTPVEIEFAVDLNEMESKSPLPVFYILQIKPLIRDVLDFSFDSENINFNDLLLYTEQGMGNGKIDDIYDVVYCDPDKFDKSKTVEMAAELEKLNDELKKQNRKYILIGPGRWGTRDKWLGIPVVWTQISNAKIIVESALKDFQVDASLGSHFFHHITSMNIGYFNVPYNHGKNFVDWIWLKSLNSVNSSNYFVHVCLNKPLIVMMDGRKSVSVIYKT